MFYLAQMSSVHVVIKDASILNPDTTSTNANLSTALGCVLCKGLQTGTKGKKNATHAQFEPYAASCSSKNVYIHEINKLLESILKSVFFFINK